MSMKLIACLGLLMVASCGAGSDPGQSERFVGRWFVEESVPRGGYNASTYELSPDGRVVLTWSFDERFPLGHVVRASDDIRCEFGVSWRSYGDDELAIDGDCSDGRAREIVIAFTNPAATNTVSTDVELASVGGEDGWEPPQFGWSFRKCTADESCRAE
jgi:hypothetical protein